MSVRRRLEDAQILLANGRTDGALLSICAAISATSRKRYPEHIVKTDRQAFTQFLGEEMRVVTAGAIQNIFARCAGSRKKYPDNLMPLQDALYEFVRCALAHEGRIADNVKFLENADMSIEVSDDGIVLGGGIARRLPLVVQFAPENASDFPEIAKMPPEVIGWMIFAERRSQQSVYLTERQRRLEAAIVVEDATFVSSCRTRLGSQPNE